MSGSRDSVPDERTVSRARKTAIISVTFTAGAGTLRATLFQYLTGAPVASGMLQSSGQIRFDNAGKGDAISIDGVCTGKATISINVETSPQTPVTFYEGNINFGFDII